MLWIAFQSAKKSFQTSRITGSLSCQHRNSSGFHSLETIQSYSTSIYSIHFAAWIPEIVKLSLHFLGAFAAVSLSTSHSSISRQVFKTLDITHNNKELSKGWAVNIRRFKIFCKLLWGSCNAQFWQEWSLTRMAGTVLVQHSSQKP